jgi:cellobiose phosphorylase
MKTSAPASNSYGHFDDAQREYVITRPDTPLPWLNYLGQDDFFGLCTNTAGGYSFWRDAKLRRLTRYRYNNVPMDLGGRYLYVKDGDTVWNPGWKPVKTQLDHYECRHGIGYSRITGANNGRARQALESVHKHLYTPNGIVLQQPAYETYHIELGEVSSYPPGYKENAGIFCHNNTWIHLGWCQQGEGDRAFEYYLSICPAAQEQNIETYRCEPYVYAQMISGRDAHIAGEAKNAWLTGTAAWTFVTVSQGIFGIQPGFDGLRIDPCIPKTWPGFKVTRAYRGASYEVTVNNPKGLSKGVTRMKVDGKEVVGNVLPLAPAGSTVKVEIELG